jgi:UDP-glucose 4-epimerase
LTDYKKTYQIFNDFAKKYIQINHIINLAGFKSVADSINFPNDYYFNNINIHLNLVKIADIFGVKSYIFSSSATVYGSSTSPLTEDSMTGIGIINPYGWTKYMIEVMIKDLSKTSNIKFIILRYFNPVGSDITNTLGENPKNKPNNLMPVLLSKIQNNLSLDVFGNDYHTKDGSCIRDFIHIYDLAIGHIKALEYVVKMETNLEIFNLGSVCGYTVIELINEFQISNDINIQYNITTRRQGDLDKCWADINKANVLLDFFPCKTLKDMCIDSYKYYLNKNNPTNTNN